MLTWEAKKEAIFEMPVSERARRERLTRANASRIVGGDRRMKRKD